ncbi:hypothetical protein NC653_041113 [Populus alba x Populus x berolinensis]|uniref:PDZ domain-containing protein n=1 Tax=Populus alba x Populus x berolinensis TaxID=444605 RepID=A0AAD6L7M9_9ROSI|nr:hypothetical protein NC653_041113 [Populus alba x Populus x berolinensis]
MSAAVVAGTTSTSCFATFSKNHSLKTTTPTSTKSFISSHYQKSNFQGLSLQDGKRGCSDIFMPNSSCSTLINVRTGLQVTARTAGAAKTIEVEVDKPLGLTLGQKSGGGVVITGVEGGGNAAKAGLKSGDQVLYTSSFFGDELWPADKLGFTKTAIQAKPDSIYFVVSRGAEVDVKRLPKRPAPPRFGRKLTEAQKARATHICLDCGFIYTLQKSFDEQARLSPLLRERSYIFLFPPKTSISYSIAHCVKQRAENRFLARRDFDRIRTCQYKCLYTNLSVLFFLFLQPEAYVCPQCRAPKKRFARYDVNTGRAVGGGLPPIGVIIGLVAGIGAVGALLVYGLQ